MSLIKKIKDEKKMKLLSRKLKIAQTQIAFEAQMIEFLQDNGLPTDKETCTLYCSMIQHLNQDEDSFVPASVAKRIRKARANAFAFYTMNPEKKPKHEEAGTSLESDLGQEA